MKHILNPEFRKEFPIIARCMLLAYIEGVCTTLIILTAVLYVHFKG